VTGVGPGAPPAPLEGANDIAATAAEGGLRRELGLREAVALGIGGTVGGGIFVLIGVAAGLAGPAALLAFVLAFVASLAIALPYAELSCRYPFAGGGYAFAHAVFGRHGGFLMGWVYWGAYVFISGYVTLGFGGYLEAVTGVPRTVGAIALVAAAVLLNLAGIKLSGRTQALVVAAAIGGLLVFALWGLGSVRSENFEPFAPLGAAGVLSASLLCFLAFGGFDMVSAAGEEIERPERNLPRAILLTLGSVLGLYLLVAFVALGVMASEALGASTAPLADAAELFGGSNARALVVVTALLTTAATANAVLVVTSRISFAMARDRLLPSPLRTVAGRTGAPSISIVLNGALLSLVAASGSVRQTASIGGFLYVLHFVVPLVALVALRRSQAAASAFETPLPKLVIPVAFIGCAALVAASGLDGIAGGSAWLGLGLVAYGLHLTRLRRAAPAT
jgi:APA family basic amino acid/polyamine antiporter